MQLLMVAVRDYLRTSSDITAILPAGAAGVIAAGDLTSETQTPALLLDNLGDGLNPLSSSVQTVRLLLSAVDRGRGYLHIEQLLHYARELVNNSANALDYLTFPPGYLTVVSIRAPATAGAGARPRRVSIERSLYIVVEVSGLTVSD